MKPSWRGWLVSVGAASSAVFSCGPSMQSIHESNVRFEHCYRLDLDGSIAPSHRQACWREWLERYTYGQSGDRIAYALRRRDEIAAGKVGLQLRLDPATAVGDAGTAMDQPAPISPHAPPPAVAPLAKAAADAGAAPLDAAAASQAEAGIPLPAADCSNACASVLARCCEAPDAGGCPRCQRDYTGCMRRCFK